MIAQATDYRGKPHSHYSCPYQTKTDWWSVEDVFLFVPITTNWMFSDIIDQTVRKLILVTAKSVCQIDMRIYSMYYNQGKNVKTLSRNLWMFPLLAYKMALFICNVKNSRYLSIYYGFFKRRLFPLRHCRHSADSANVYRIERVASDCCWCCHFNSFSFSVLES